ncbi:MAG: hypothetical protein EOO77_31745 [Oxalobacteraceae bacterium]|nr:MAG: hypothetical protein EOO77_31745 [Oxalobacteraceae bacterium]
MALRSEVQCCEARYQWGNPATTTMSLDGNGYIAGVTNPLYDESGPYLNTTLRYPALFTTGDLVSASRLIDCCCRGRPASCGKVGPNLSKVKVSLWRNEPTVPA